jgi:hypothetical protein
VAALHQEEDYQTGDNQIVSGHRGGCLTKYGKVGQLKESLSERSHKDF